MTRQNEHQTVKDMCEIERQTERLGWETEAERGRSTGGDSQKIANSDTKEIHGGEQNTRSKTLHTSSKATGLGWVRVIGKWKMGDGGIHDNERTTPRSLSRL